MKTNSLSLTSFRPILAAGVLGLAVIASARATATAVPANPAPATAAAPEEDIRDIRPPFHIPSNLPWIIGAASTAVLAAAGYGAWRWTRSGSRTLLPYEIALQKLQATRPLIHSETTREFSIAVSEIVRSFIEQSVPVRAAHRTTDEFLHELAAQSDSPLAAHRETFIPFLEHCDLAKFARWNLPECRMESMFDCARAFILSIGAPAAPTTPTLHHSTTPSSKPAPTVEPALTASRHSDFVIRH